jgi:serine/threonine-protein kinase
MARNSSEPVPISGITMNTPSPRASFEPGSIVGGKYRIVSLIGIGGVGRVYLARHVELDTEVAIKVLRPEMTERQDAVQRFGREARASVRLRSERIARVFDVGTQDGMPYFVMEYMVGCDLLDLRQQGKSDVATLAEFFIQACEGLADAHAQGVVHRDIKPENLFIVRDANGWRTLKIFDFGISKFSLTGKFSDVDLSAMRTEVMMGTPHYISPEQIRSTRDVDHRTDLWSLGVVMFEVLSGGILPFREEREVTALIAEVLEKPHRSLLDVAPNVPEGLAAIVDRCLVKDREQRYQTAAEIALDLLPFAPVRARASAERAVSAMQSAGLLALNFDIAGLRPSQPPSDRSRAVTPTARPPVSQTPQPLEASQIVDEEGSKPRRRTASLVALVAAVAALAFGVTRWTHRAAQEPLPEAPQAALDSARELLPEASAPALEPAPVSEKAVAPTAKPSVAPRPPVAFQPRGQRPIALAPAPVAKPAVPKPAIAKPVVAKLVVAQPAVAQPALAKPPASEKSESSAPAKLELRRER